MLRVPDVVRFALRATGHHVHIVVHLVQFFRVSVVVRVAVRFVFESQRIHATKKVVKMEGRKPLIMFFLAVMFFLSPLIDRNLFLRALRTIISAVREGRVRIRFVPTVRIPSRKPRIEILRGIAGRRFVLPVVSVISDLFYAVPAKNRRVEPFVRFPNAFGGTFVDLRQSAQTHFARMALMVFVIQFGNYVARFERD